jgi:hypothetical protein
MNVMRVMLWPLLSLLGAIYFGYRFVQNRSRTSVVALKSDAAAEKSKDRLSRDFLGCSIFDFCNKIGHQRTSRLVRLISALPPKADMHRRSLDFDSIAIG